MIGTAQKHGAYDIYTGVAGGADNAIVIETDEVSQYDYFELLGTGGAADVDVCLDVDESYSTSPLSLEDKGATAAAPVVVTAANRLYAFVGNFHKIRVRQAGATAATTYKLRCFRRGT